LLDGHLLDFEPRVGLRGVKRFVVEFLYFGAKEARACLFVGLFFTAVFAVPRAGSEYRDTICFCSLQSRFRRGCCGRSWYIGACTLGLYARATVIFRPLDRDRSMPLLLSFVLIGFFIWLAENISTFFGVWRYPNQVGAWAVVHLGKWSSWSLLVIMTFTIVANLKHLKSRIHVPP
jgi:uncharacterized membrane protein YoaT (DUF817 family)